MGLCKSDALSEIYKLISQRMLLLNGALKQLKQKLSVCLSPMSLGPVHLLFCLLGPEKFSSKYYVTDINENEKTSLGSRRNHFRKSKHVGAIIDSHTVVEGNTK